MGKNKFKRFQENLTFVNLIQPEFSEIFEKDYKLKGRWKQELFRNSNPLVLELGCGRGEYTISLAEMFPDKNFIGIDIKGARIWRGAKTATEQRMMNVAFLRTRIEFINSFFGEGEVDEIWITFPDPQLKNGRAKKRLTGPEFLAHYSKFMKADAKIHLKTDSLDLHEYTKAVTEANSLPVSDHSKDIYGTNYANEILSIKTSYEKRFLQQGMPITYLCFRLGDRKNFIDPF